MRYTPMRHTPIGRTLVRYTPIRYLFTRRTLMNSAPGALLPPACGDHSALKPEMMDSSVLASAVRMTWRTVFASFAASGFGKEHQGVHLFPLMVQTSAGTTRAEHPSSVDCSVDSSTETMKLSRNRSIRYSFETFARV
jgi:hypothetical protein